MTTFSTELPATRPLDPTKRVRYTTGLVLGVDEFTQEQTYHSSRMRLLNRLLHGYGTVSGLKVSTRVVAAGPEVLVSAGAAVDRRGEMVCVRSNQCAKLNAWLQANAEDARRNASPAGELSVHVVLRYRECEADWVPVPGGPCRRQDDTRMASRLVDAFELTLTLRRPEQREEDAARKLGELLAAIEISDNGGLHSSDDDVIAAVREVQQPLLSPPVPTLRFSTTTAPERMRTLYRTWITETRSTAMSTGDGCCENPVEEWLLLARLAITLDANTQVSGNVIVDERDRPILIPSRALQEGR